MEKTKKTTSTTNNIIIDNHHHHAPPSITTTAAETLNIEIPRHARRHPLRRYARQRRVLDLVEPRLKRRKGGNRPAAPPLSSAGAPSGGSLGEHARDEAGVELADAQAEGICIVCTCARVGVLFSAN